MYFNLSFIGVDGGKKTTSTQLIVQVGSHCRWRAVPELCRGIAVASSRFLVLHQSSARRARVFILRLDVM